MKNNKRLKLCVSLVSANAHFVHALTTQAREQHVVLCGRLSATRATAPYKIGPESSSFLSRWYVPAIRLIRDENLKTLYCIEWDRQGMSGFHNIFVRRIHVCVYQSSF